MVVFEGLRSLPSSDRVVRKRSTIIRRTTMDPAEAANARQVSESQRELNRFNTKYHRIHNAAQEQFKLRVRGRPTSVALEAGVVVPIAQTGENIARFSLPNFYRKFNRKQPNLSVDTLKALQASFYAVASRRLPWDHGAIARAEGKSKLTDEERREYIISKDEMSAYLGSRFAGVAEDPEFMEEMTFINTHLRSDTVLSGVSTRRK